MNKKESTPKDILDVLIKNEEIENVLENEEWQENVADAAFIAALYTKSLNKDPKEIIDEVIHYNVIKQFRNLFINNAKPLPKNIIWKSGYSKLDAIYLFENYISQVYLTKENGNLKNKITLNIYAEDKSLQDDIKKWCKKYSKLYTDLNISCKQSTKTKNKISIYFK